MHNTKRKTHNEFVKEVYDLVGDEYTVIGKYVNNKTKILMRHNICGNEWCVIPNNFLKGSRCPNESQIRSHKNTTKTHDEFVKEVYNLVGNEYTVVGNYINSKTKILMKHNLCGNEWHVLPNDFLKGSRCPQKKCSKRINPLTMTTEEFKEKVYKLVKDEYTVLGEYTGLNKKILMRHNLCGNEWHVIPNSFLNGSRCPNEAKNKKMTDEEFKLKLYNKNPNIVCLDTYINSTTKLRFKCLIDNQIFISKPADILVRGNCPYCSGRKIAKGINDLWTTHPEIAKLLKNTEDGYKYSYGTHEKLLFLCPNCNNIIKSRPIDLFNRDTHTIRCKKCSDGISFPEKFMYNFLQQLNVNFVCQVTNSILSWCGKFRYDFYLPDYNMIIETHGLQHYEKSGFTTRTLLEEQENDKIKEQLAKSNGIKKYIIIDCRYSELEWISNSILSSRLNEIFNLKNISWNDCAINAVSSMIVKTCDLWNKNQNINLYDLSKMIKLSISTVYRYLEIGNKYNMCVFDKTKYIDSIKEEWYDKAIRNKRKKVYCFVTGEVFESASEADRYYGIQGVSAVCNGKRKTCAGSKWSYVDDLPKDFIIKKTGNTLMLANNSKRKINNYCNNIFVNTYESISVANKDLNYKYSYIKLHIDNKKPDKNNYVWYYANDPNQPDKTKIIV